MSQPAQKHDRLTVNYPDEVASWFNQLLDTGYFMSRSDIIREGLRRLTQLENQPYQDIRGYDGTVNSDRITIRLPPGLHDFEHWEAGKTVRVGVAVVAEEYLGHRAVAAENICYV